MSVLCWTFQSSLLKHQRRQASLSQNRFIEISDTESSGPASDGEKTKPTAEEMDEARYSDDEITFTGTFVPPEPDDWEEIQAAMSQPRRRARPSAVFRGRTESVTKGTSADASHSPPVRRDPSLSPSAHLSSRPASDYSYDDNMGEEHFGYVEPSLQDDGALSRASTSEAAESARSSVHDRYASRVTQSTSSFASAPSRSPSLSPPLPAPNTALTPRRSPKQDRSTPRKDRLRNRKIQVAQQLVSMSIRGEVLAMLMCLWYSAARMTTSIGTQEC